MSEQQQPPKAFISYSWSSTEHVDWVLELAKRLRANGVDAVLDRWHLKPGQDKFHFMESMVVDPTVTKVLVICDQLYAAKADERRGGVGTESTIISQEVYNKVEQRKFIPVIAEKDNDGAPFLPVFLRSRIYIDLSSPQTFEEKFEDLLREIFDHPMHSPPPLGPTPAFLNDGATTTRAALYKFRAFEAAIVAGKPTTNGLINDYLRAVNIELQEFQLSPQDQQSGEQWDDVVMRSIESLKPLRDEFIRFCDILARYGWEPRQFENLHVFFEQVLLHTDPWGYKRTLQDNFTFIVYELFLSAVAVLIKHNRFNETNSLLSEGYRVVDENFGSRPRIHSFGVFSYPASSLEEDRQRRLYGGGYRRPSLTGRLLKERVTSDIISFDDLCGADYVMFFRSHFGSPTSDVEWLPYTLRVRSESFPLPLFERASYRRFFAQLKNILGVESKAELVEKIESAIQERATGQWPYNNRFLDFHPDYHKALMNLDKLDSL